MKIVPVKHGLEDIIGVSTAPRTVGLHMSEIYNDLYQDLEPKRYIKGSKPDVLRMEAGLAFEDMLEEGLKRRLAGSERPGEFTTEEGILYTPDLIIFNGETRLGEIKLTWMSSKEVPRELANGFPPKFDKYFCVAPTTRILTSDLQWVFAGDIKAGDSLVGFDEHGNPKRHIRHTRVISNRTVLKPCVRLELADGTEVTCSTDHHWFIKTSGGEGRWERTDRLLATDQISGAPRKHNFSLCRVSPSTWGSTSLDEHSQGWLAGVFDGEGSISKSEGSALRMMVAQKKGPVLSRLRKLLRDDEYKTFETEQHGCRHIMLATQADIWRFLAKIRPVRLLEKFGALSNLGGFSYDPVRVVRRVELGDRPVSAITTDSHTFIAEGFASHNTQMKAYCYHLDLGHARLLAFFVNGDYRPPKPELLAWDIEFSSRELRENWQMLLNHVNAKPYLRERLIV